MGPGSIERFEVGGRSIVLVRAGDGSFHALRNMCSHQGAPLDAGRLIDEVRATGTPGGFEVRACQAVLRCPWHGYEFALDTGRCLADPEHNRVRVYPVTVEDGTVCVDI